MSTLLDTGLVFGVLQTEHLSAPRGLTIVHAGQVHPPSTGVGGVTVLISIEAVERGGTLFVFLHRLL